MPTWASTRVPSAVAVLRRSTFSSPIASRYVRASAIASRLLVPVADAAAERDVQRQRGDEGGEEQQPEPDHAADAATGRGAEDRRPRRPERPRRRGRRASRSSRCRAPRAARGRRRRRAARPRPAAAATAGAAAAAASRRSADRRPPAPRARGRRRGGRGRVVRWRSHQTRPAPSSTAASQRLPGSAQSGACERTTIAARPSSPMPTTSARALAPVAQRLLGERALVALGRHHEPGGEVEEDPRAAGEREHREGEPVHDRAHVEVAAEAGADAREHAIVARAREAA